MHLVCFLYLNSYLTQLTNRLKNMPMIINSDRHFAKGGIQKKQNKTKQKKKKTKKTNKKNKNNNKKTTTKKKTKTFNTLS